MSLAAIEGTEETAENNNMDKQGATPMSNISKRQKEMGLFISFHAFFRPDLGNLEDEAPKVDAPLPAGKQDPTPINKIPGLGDSE